MFLSRRLKKPHMALKESAFFNEKSVLTGFKTFEKLAVCDFFKEFY